MNRDTIENSRIRRLNERPVVKGQYVLYWMQHSQRAEQNPALEAAVARANELKLPLVVGFGLTGRYPEANLRHYRFMLEGLRETRLALLQRGIPLLVKDGEPDEVALDLSKKAAAVFCDRGYLRHQKAWRLRVARKACCPVFQVEGDVVIPVKVLSSKAEWAARTLRPKINRVIESYMCGMRSEVLRYSDLDMAGEGLNLDDPVKLEEALGGRDDLPPVSKFFQGGTSKAVKLFERFLEKKCFDYAENHNQPQTDNTSMMSPYLHFGQISPLFLALKIRAADHLAPLVREAFLEQLIVRRELAVNYVNFHPDYDRYEGIPSWARQTLREHQKDQRPAIYDLVALEKAETHDMYWNAAMREMIHSGYMHNYMRMYWGKKILEWSEKPRKAFETILYLNNKYFLDGRDSNSYAGVAWIFGLHDRPWKERPIFGKVRYMAASGLERKCDIRAYVEKVKKLIQK